ncbi:MAG: AMP-binding protein [Pirellula sp.]|nr:AMP-binding protein [Pirellula sp.]
MSQNQRLSDLTVRGSLFDAFQLRVSEWPEAVAWVAANPEETRSYWTWSELSDSVLRTAATLRRSGVNAGDRVANLGKNCAEWAILDLACSAIGAVHAPIDARVPDAWIHACLKQLEPTYVCGGKRAGTRFAHANSSLQELIASKSVDSFPRLSEVDPKRTACILFTSGTTSSPRGVMLSHHNLLSNAAAKLDAMPQSPDDLRLNLLPFSHAYARTCELTTWILAGGTMACAHGIDSALAQAARLRPHLLNAVPAFYEELARLIPSTSLQSTRIADMLGGRMRRLASGGAPLQDRVRQIFSHAELPVFQGYGLTEASPVVCSNRVSHDQPPILCGVGPAVQGVQVRVDEDQRLWVSGEGVMQGYWRDPQATEERIIDGWLDTRDIASIDVADGQASLRIEGRLDEVQILANGYKFSPRPLEHRLAGEMDAVAYCLLLGNGRRKPILAVQLATQFEHVDGAKLLSQAKEVLKDQPDYIVPDAVWISPEPWTVTNGCLHWKGGINRREIQRRIGSA